jgi:hypothetical protein
MTASIITSPKLRKLDFTSCIRRVPSPANLDQGEDNGCGVVEAVYPLCVNKNTNVDWVALNGIHFSQTDFEFIIGMVAKKDCNLRAIELSGCHLDSLSLRQLLGELPTQHETLESIVLSNNPGRFSPDISGQSYAQFKSIRVLDLSGLHVTAEPAPLILREVLFSWPLEVLRLSKCRINESTLDALVDYLQHDSSKALGELHLDNCQIGSEGAVRIYTAISEGAHAGQNRELHVDLSENHIRPLMPFTAALTRPWGPSSLALRLLEFDAAADLRALFSALATNTSLHTLDLSEALLDFRLDDESDSEAEEKEEDDDCTGVAAAICSALARNRTLRTLDLSGADSRLESSSLGPAGVAGALRGLRANAALRTLRLRSQRLGLRAANELADALRANGALRELALERNAVPLAGLVAVVDAVRGNRALVKVGGLEDAKRAALRSVRAAVEAMARSDDGGGGGGVHLSDVTVPAAAVAQAASVRARAALGFMSMGLYHQQSHHGQQHRELPPAPDVAEATAIVEGRWDAQLAVLARCLARNARLAAGEDAGSLDDGEEGRGEGVGLASSPEAPSERGAAERALAGAAEGEEKTLPEARGEQKHDEAGGEHLIEHKHDEAGGEHIIDEDTGDVGLAIAGLALETDAAGGAAADEAAEGDGEAAK